MRLAATPGSRSDCACARVPPVSGPVRVLGLLVRMGVDDRDLEIAVLRHQLRIISRRGNRSRYRTADRAFLAAASRLLPRERWSAFLVCPDTLTRWRPA